MRRPRGNIIITALFVAIFLFFLSVALLWTNRQDIALSLSMEHKMKAQSAARSAAMETYAKLRRFGEAESGEFEMESGATVKVELLRVKAEGKNGQRLLIRSRGQSGPVSSFYTLHLLESTLASSESEDQSPRFLMMTNGTASKAIYGDFKLNDLALGGSEKTSYAASQGPLFQANDAQTAGEVVALTDYMPVFINGQLLAYGPIVMVGPAPTDARDIEVLKFEGEELKWKTIEAPLKLGAPAQQQQVNNAIFAFEFKARDSYAVSSLKAVGDVGTQWIWGDDQPATEQKEEMEDPAVMAGFEIDLADATLDWSSVPKVEPRRAYSLRGSIAAEGETVYSHAWEYLYRQYDGNALSPPIPDYVGNTVTRWPCILKNDGEWSVAWSVLDESGNVKTPWLPNPEVLWVSGGKLYSETLEPPARLLTLSQGSAVVGQTLPDGGKMFLYQGMPFSTSLSGLVNLAGDQTIGFESLPSGLPEISGLSIVPQESNIVGLEGETVKGDPVDVEQTIMQTTRPEYTFSYTLVPEVTPATDGKDLWMTLSVAMTPLEPSFTLLGKQEYAARTVTALARYDGERWNIMPNGLRALLRQTSLAAPAITKQLYAPRYADLPSARARYTVLSISTEAFDFNQ